VVSRSLPRVLSVKLAVHLFPFCSQLPGHASHRIEREGSETIPGLLAGCEGSMGRGDLPGDDARMGHLTWGRWTSPTCN
jgi:hypothetical protein